MLGAAATLSLAGVACVGMLAQPARAQTPAAPIDLSVIGKEAPKSVLAYRGVGKCDGKRDELDCGFVSPEGVIYNVFEGRVCEIHLDKAKVSKTVVLPYGLKFNDAKAEAAAKLPKKNILYGSWFEYEGRQAYDTGGGFFGNVDDLSSLILWFDASGRLAEVEAHATCV